MSDETNQDTDAGSIASIEAALEDYRNEIGRASCRGRV